MMNSEQNRSSIRAYLIYYFEIIYAWLWQVRKSRDQQSTHLFVEFKRLQSDVPEGWRKSGKFQLNVS